jgi:hypothetical protein
MHRNKVESSHISEIGYDPINRTLEVEFSGGEVYAYRGVPQDEHARFLASPSHGQYLHFEIKDKYTCKRIK